MDALGINIFNIIVYTILFVLLCVILKKYLAGPLMSMLEKRAQAVHDVQKGQEDLAKNREELNNRSATLEEKLRKELKDEREKAITEAKAEKQKIIEAAKKEAEAIVEKANQRLDQERKQQEQAMASKVQQATARVLKEVYHTDRKEIDPKLIQQALQELS